MNSASGNNPQSWLDAYVQIADAKSPMTPMDFHEAIGLWIVSTVIARRLVIKMPHDEVYPNLWVMLVAPSTLYAKTTAMNNGRSMVQNVVPHLVFPDSSTPEAMLEELGGKSLEGAARDQAGQRGLIIDEASGMLAASGRDYMAGNLELYMRLYDSPLDYQRSTRSQGRVKISGPYLTILGASTPGMLAPYTGSLRMWANGWWPRFGLVPFPDEKPSFRHSATVDHRSEECLKSTLLTLHQRLSQPKYPNAPESRSVTLTPEADQAYLEFSKRMRYDLLVDSPSEAMGAAYGRAPTQALKIATCLSAMEWSEGQDAPVITIQHWQRGQSIAEKWVAGAQRVVQLAHRQGGNENIRRVHDVIMQSKDWISVRDLCRKTSLKASEVHNALTELSDAGEIERNSVSKGGHVVTEARLMQASTTVVHYSPDAIYG